MLRGFLCAMLLASMVILAQETTGSIEGVIVDQADDLLSDVAVTVVGATSLAAKTDYQGKFVMTGLAPGFYKLEISLPGFTPREIATTAAPGRERSLGRIILQIAVPACVQSITVQALTETKTRSGTKLSLSGILRTDAGRPRVNATISLAIEETAQTIAFAKTNDAGEFFFADLSSGVYSLSFDDFIVRGLRVKDRRGLHVMLDEPQQHEIRL
jgi:hypothetical protein